LIDPLIGPADVFTVNQAWGTGDAANHGTGLAGISGYGDLQAALAASGTVEASHRLESVKLVPHDGAGSGGALHHARMFIDAVTAPEARFGLRKRVFSSATRLLTTATLGGHLRGLQPSTRWHPTTAAKASFPASSCFRPETPKERSGPTTRTACR
jgi:hypothetical protein